MIAASRFVEATDVIDRTWRALCDSLDDEDTPRGEDCRVVYFVRCGQTDAVKVYTFTKVHTLSAIEAYSYLLKAILYKL